MSAAHPFVPSSVDPIPGKGADSTSVGAIHPEPVSLAHWIHGQRLRLCLTPSADGLIGVSVSVPAAAMPTPSRYGLHVNAGHDAARFFGPSGLTVDVDRCLLRGFHQTSPDYCPAYRCGFELDLEPCMVAGVSEAVRSCAAISRRITMESGPCSSEI